MINPNDSYLVYTDGSCWHGDRIGAYAWVAIDGEGNELMDGGVERDSTITRMELWGPIAALETIYEINGPSVVLVYSDSEIVVKGITDRSRARRVAHDLWEWLDDLVDSHELVVFEHVRGHNGDHYNEMVDVHAGKLRREAQAYADPSSQS